MWKTSAIWAAGYQPMAIVTKTVKSGLAKPAGVWKATRCMEEQTHQPKGQGETV